MIHEQRFGQIHTELRQHWRCGSDTRELERLIRQLQAEVAQEQAEITQLIGRTPDQTPAKVVVTIY